MLLKMLMAAVCSLDAAYHNLRSCNVLSRLDKTNWPSRDTDLSVVHREGHTENILVVSNEPPGGVS